MIPMQDVAKGKGRHTSVRDRQLAKGTLDGRRAVYGGKAQTGSETATR